MSVVNFSGLASGIDTQGIINALVGAQRIPIQKLSAKSANVDVRISKMGELKSKLSTLRTAANEFKTASDILAYSATSSVDSVVGVKTGAGALPGSFEVKVNELARVEKNRSAGFSSSGEEVRAGTLSIAINGADAVDIDIEEGMTLRQVADAINAKGVGAQASLVSDGTSTYLQISSKNTGYSTTDADDALVITENYTGAAGQTLSMVQTQQATNAELEVDGLVVTSRNNTVSTAVEGVTFELKALGTSTISVASDQSQTRDNLKKLVDAYNDVLGFIRKELTVSENTNRDRTLSGDPAVRQLRQGFASFISGNIAGVSGAFSSLSQIGIKTDATGKLDINSSQLNDALDKDPLGVAEVFLKADTGIVARIDSLAKSYTDPLDGILTQREKALQGQKKNIGDQVIRLEDRLEQYRERLKKQFLAMESVISGLNAQAGQLASLQVVNAAPAGGNK